MFLTPYLFPCKPMQSAFFAGLWYHITSPRLLQAQKPFFTLMLQKVCNAPPVCTGGFILTRPAIYGMID
jgi:hypothetical protein